MLQAEPSLVQVDRRPEEVRTPGEPFPDVRRLVIARNDRLGDLVLTLPAIAALRETYRAAWLGLLVKPYAAPLAACVEGVDEVVVDAGTQEALTERLRGFAADLIVSIAPGGRAGWCAWRAGIPHRVGPGYRLYSPIFERTVDEHRRRRMRHEVELALAYAHRAGAAAGPARFPLVLPDEARASAEAWRGEHQVPERYVVLHPGSGGSCPGWPPGHFAGLAELLIGRGIGVVVSVGPADDAVAKALDEATPVVRRAPRFGGELPSLAALLGGASLVVASSTGPLHLAAALGTPTLALHAPWPSCGPARWGPYAGNGWALVAELADARGWSRAERRARGGELLAAIAPSAVLAAVLAHLEK